MAMEWMLFALHDIVQFTSMKERESDRVRVCEGDK